MEEEQTTLPETLTISKDLIKRCLCFHRLLCSGYNTYKSNWIRFSGFYSR